MSLLSWKIGDREPALVVAMAENDGTVISLVDTTVDMEITKPDGTVVTVEMLVTDDVGGVARYEWQDGDLDVAGFWHARYIVHYATGDRTVPAPSFDAWTVEDPVIVGITWTQVAALASELSDLDAGAQLLILEHVNAALDAAIWGGESSPKLRLARIYLAAHYGTLARSNGNAAAGPVISESAGGLSRTYANMSVVGATRLDSTSWGRLYSELVATTPARAGFVI